MLEQCMIPGRVELAYAKAVTYKSFGDPMGGRGAEIRRAGFGCDDRGPFDRSSRLSVGIPTHWNYNGDDGDD
jgi:hypothetical protein